MSQTIYPNIAVWNSTIFGLTGMISNSFCMFLIVYLHHNEMKRFRVLLTIYCFLDILYSLSYLNTKPGFALIDNVYLFFSYTSWGEHVEVGKIFMLIHAVLFIDILTLLTVLYFIRFWSFTYFYKQKKIPILISILLLLIVMTIMPVCYCYPAFSKLWTSPGIRQYDLNMIQMSNIQLEIDGFVYFGINTTSEQFKEIVIAFSLSLSVILIEALTMIFCGFSIYCSVRKMTSSEVTSNLQKQILIYLCLQSTTCFIGFIFPVSLFVLSTAFGFSLNRFGTIAVGMLAWIPTFDAFILLTCVSPYKDAVKEFVFGSCLFGSSVAPSVALNTLHSN